MFKPVGKIQKDHAALRVVVDGWKLGTLVIGAADVSKMLNGDEVTIHFVQQRPGREPFIGYAGSARISRSGKAINVKIEARRMSAPLAQVQKVIAGQQLAARLSAPGKTLCQNSDKAFAPIIDADGRQARPIDEGLTHSF